MTDDISLSVSRVIKATPEALYNAWLTPETMMRFMHPCVGGSCPVAETDPHVGGKYRIVMNDGERDIPHWGTYTALDPHTRISFTWQSIFLDHETDVVVRFIPEREATRVELTHTKFRSEQSRDGHNAGWSEIMDVLENLYA